MADLSSNNGAVDLATYSDAGHAVIAIKATEGLDYVNPFHLYQCREAHKLGLTVVHYHFCRPGNDNPIGEIYHFRNTYLRGWKAGDYACFDLEVNEGRNVSQYAQTICRQFERLTKHPPILYTYISFAREHLTRITVPGNRWWIAKYSNGQPKLSRPMSLWAWQYTDGKDGPSPRFFEGIGKCDGSILTYGVAIRCWVRKKRTKEKEVNNAVSGTPRTVRCSKRSNRRR